jgi:hypothetical protein
MDGVNEGIESFQMPVDGHGACDMKTRTQFWGVGPDGEAEAWQ